MSLNLGASAAAEMRTNGIGETPKAPWDWKVLEPSLDVACPFPLLGS